MIGILNQVGDDIIDFNKVCAGLSKETEVPISEIKKMYKKYKQSLPTEAEVIEEDPEFANMNSDADICNLLIGAELTGGMLGFTKMLTKISKYTGISKGDLRKMLAKHKKDRDEEEVTKEAREALENFNINEALRNETFPRITCYSVVKGSGHRVVFVYEKKKAKKGRPAHLIIFDENAGSSEIDGAMMGAGAAHTQATLFGYPSAEYYEKSKEWLLTLKNLALEDLDDDSKFRLSPFGDFKDLKKK